MQQNQKTLNSTELQTIIAESLRGYTVDVLDLITVLTLMAIACVKRTDGGKKAYLKAVNKIWEEAPALENQS